MCDGEKDDDRAEKEDAKKNGDDSESENKLQNALLDHDDDSQEKPPFKYAPPIGKQRQIPLLTKDPTHSGSVAGPSSIHPLKHASKD